ncbi:MAG: asparagine synthase (glutamine-hydrolyzing) [Alphaproteobacteria bacterium]|nr:MAG: asparagine synthase (glutamine-hydrolyzing) [Alphaproteobacteria bacterium]
MCSIIGHISKTPQASAMAEVQHLLHAMHHRGPDAGHARTCSNTTLLASNRLRITDAANPAADMPMVSPDGRFTLVFNGEIYNHTQLRNQLAGYPFTTSSDTEVLLAAFATWGRACLPMLEGMFAFCIHDATDDSTLIASDPTGQKTAYIYEDDTAILVASELDPLISNPHRTKNWDHNGLAEYIAQRFILGGNTHIRQIRKLLSGTWEQFSPQGHTQGRFYHVPIGRQHFADVPAICDTLKQTVTNACNLTFNLEVPYGLFLSGGIDSTAVLALASQRGLTMRTFSIGFDMHNLLPNSPSVLNEFEYSRALAKQFNTLHHEIILRDEDYCTYLDTWADMSGEPLGSQEAPCLVRLMEEAHPHVRVVFSGSGPDEIFDGYSSGKDMSAAAMEDLPDVYARTFGWVGGTDLNRLMPHHNATAITAAKLRDILSLYPQVTNPLQAVQLLHFHGRLGVYEFRQMDVISMNASIEVRSPLTDTSIVAAAFDFDPALKQSGGEKGIFKQALASVVPPFIRQRKKQGFPIPSEMWFSPAFEARARILFDTDCILVACGLINPAYLRQLWESPDPDTRNIFSRLYTLERILRRQAPNVT